MNKDLSIVIFANRKDFFLTKLCISSIRFYYPDIEIFLIKDKLNGDFNTSLLRRKFKVKLLKLGKKYFGWSAAKIHFILDRNIPVKRYLCLDSDIIFIGHVIEELEKTEGEFVFNPQFLEPPFTNYVKEIFLNPEEVKTYFPDYEYPGYFFNGGQTIVTPGIINEKHLSDCFNSKKYPYYKNRNIFKVVDQSILNAVIPVLRKRENIKVSTVEFMKLSCEFFKNEENDDIIKLHNMKLPYIVHYAGDVRTPNLDKMKGSKVLKEFKKMYYSEMSNFEQSYDRIQDFLTTNSLLTKILYKKNRFIIEVLNKFT